jgi:hypothetical protein
MQQEQQQQQQQMMIQLHAGMVGMSMSLPGLSLPGLGMVGQVNMPQQSSSPSKPLLAAAKAP